MFADEPCACAMRRDAEKEGELVYSATLGGWIMPELKTRRRSLNALLRYTMGQLDKLPANDPYVWTCCPFCGADLQRDTPDAEC